MNSNALKAKLVLNGMSVSDLLEKLNDLYKVKMSKSAFYRKLNGSSEFDRKEIVAISTCLEIDASNLLSIFFGEKVS
ncbi:hypothetical protein P40081_00965 [Paenibacillus sp. FSL P4-0081]|jgi:hypothetical protein|uniref:hypothetical protein n=1 Tax=Paenibacillus sp. FSL P4-0081 TaxID=1536769 RepID=UPI0004F8F09B|nr:hypothetical protein [Paenibacillus sp. FSL P4-0081]AIQ26936.1 hypothetical protein P40081_00965 [Paenibacillus sp. FSL P4-0081]